MTNEKLKSLRPRTRGVILVAFLWILQSVGRLYFAILGTPWGMGQFLDVQISHAVSLVMFLMFLLLGMWGLFAAFGLLIGRKWGFWNITLVSIVTIAFDIWGLTIQYTAAIGFIVPAISILYLYPKKTQLLAALN